MQSGKSYRLPWDQTTLLGYFGEIFINVLILGGYLLTNGALLLLFMSICVYHQTFSKMFKHLIVEMNQDKMKEKYICSLTSFHISTKQ